jgi:Tol biopolymer transport system component
MNADGTNVKNLTRDTSISGSDPNWSPNGRKIVFAAFLPSTVDIFVMQADGTLPRNLTKTPDKWEGQPAFSPDGRKIIYIRFGGVFKMNADGTEHQGLPTGRDAGVPDWQPLP